MTKPTGGLVVRMASWLVAITVTVLLVMLVQRLEYAIYCWPSSGEAVSWRLVHRLTLAAMLLTVAPPLAATLFSNRHPRVAMGLAVAGILAGPMVYVMLLQWAPPLPR
jgi:hypothetical protein